MNQQDMAGPKLLAIAVASKNVGYVFLEKSLLADWGLSYKASRSPQAAAAKAREWIDLLKPEAVVTERIGEHSRKHGKTPELITAIAAAAKQAHAIHAAVPRLYANVARIQTHKNKYLEAESLAEQYPALLTSLCDKPKCWQSEPRKLIIFEALVLALTVRLDEGDIVGWESLAA